MNNRDLNIGILPENKAFGVNWNIQEDNLGFTITLDDKPATRRGLLAILRCVYCPLGLESPFLLKDRLIIQNCAKTI